MPPRVQNVNAAGTGIGAWYNSIPPVTRCYATGLLAVTLGARIGLIPLAQCALIWDLVIKKFHVSACIMLQTVLIRV